jgi:transposase
LTRFAVEGVGGWLSPLSRVIIATGRPGGPAAYHPATLLALLSHDYATGVSTSQRDERAIYDAVAFRHLAGNKDPDPDQLAALRRRFLREIEGFFVQVLTVAGEMRGLKLGIVALDPTKIPANARRHSAMSCAHAERTTPKGPLRKDESAVAGEGAGALELAKQAEIPDGMSLPKSWP